MARKLVAALLAFAVLAHTVSGLSMILQAHDEECFTESLKEGDRLQGSFLVIRGGFTDIDCTVYGPRDQIHYAVQRETEGRFLILAPEAGIYRVCFSNKMSTLTEKMVSFSIHQGESLLGADLAKKEHITPLENLITELSQGIANIRDTQSYMRTRERVHRDTSESTNSRVLWFTFMEAVVLIGMSVWQIWTLRRFFETRADV